MWDGTETAVAVACNMSVMNVARTAMSAIHPPTQKTTGNYRLKLLITHTQAHTHTHTLVCELSWKWLALRFLRLRCAYSTERDLTWLNHDIEEDNDNVCWWSSTDDGNNYVDVDYLLPGCCIPQRFLIKLMKCILWLLVTAQPENNQLSHDDDNLIQTIEWRFMGSLKIAVDLQSSHPPDLFRFEFLYKLQQLCRQRWP